MPVVAPVRRTAARVAALIAATLALGVAAGPVVVAPAAAAPTPVAKAPADPEGGTPALRAQLAAASKGWLDANDALNRSVARQKKLGEQLVTIEKNLAERDRTVGVIAGAAYRSGRLGAASALVASDSPAQFLDRVAALDAVAAYEDREVRGLLATRDQATRAKAAVDAEIVEQRRQLAVMAKRKQQAEQALTVANRKATAATSSGSSRSATAKPAPRNSDGTWPAESCSVNDPTPADGCITPRMLHALNQAKAAGFTRYVSCFRSGGSGEHPKGRACDFAAQKNGFGGDATGADKTYGDNLAAYFKNNASRLGVLYVIWYRQIWLPSSGWKSYSGANGDPSSDHTNHVHVSVY